MTTEALKSASVTAADATPAQAITSGKGGKARLHSINDYLTPTSGKTSGSTYRFTRVPSNAIIKHLYSEGGAQTQGSYDWGVYYSDGADSAVPAGTVIDADFFASAQSFASAVAITDITNESGTYTADKRNQPLWQAVGLSTDPGGMFDIVATNTNTITTGALMGLEVQLVG